MFQTELCDEKNKAILPFFFCGYHIRASFTVIRILLRRLTNCGSTQPKYTKALNLTNRTIDFKTYSLNN